MFLSEQKPFFKKLPARYMTIVMPLILSFMMSGVVSLISTLKNTGWHQNILSLWLTAWAISWIVAFPTVLLVLPLARKFAGLFVQQA